ncbi:hypothetical protein [Methylogaea oryzae]|uniref:hypothetical protein n=1 Tax=Methylogaea oryzae TaxID=1295382 RepID=UPI0012E27CD1|nr:hypothetical protein [Methylogaea oryzae]
MAYLGSSPNEYLFSGVTYKVTDIFYTCRADDISKIRPHDDVAEFRLMDPRDVDPADLSFPSVRAAFAMLLARL